MGREDRKKLGRKSRSHGSEWETKSGGTTRERRRRVKAREGRG